MKPRAMSRKKKLKNNQNEIRKNCRSEDDEESAEKVVLRKKSLSEVKSCNDLTDTFGVNDGSEVLSESKKNPSNLYLIKSHSFIDKAVDEQPDISKIRSMLLESVSEKDQVKKRPKSVPNSASAKRESFLRQSFHRLSRSFSRNKNKDSSTGNSSNSSTGSNEGEKLDKLKEEEDLPVTDHGAPDEGEGVDCIVLEVKPGVIR